MALKAVMLSHMSKIEQQTERNKKNWLNIVYFLLLYLQAKCNSRRKNRHYNPGSAHGATHQPHRRHAQQKRKQLRASHVDLKCFPDKQQEGLANTFIFKVNINLTSLVTGWSCYLEIFTSLLILIKKEKKSTCKKQILLLLNANGTREESEIILYVCVLTSSQLESL